MDITKHPFFHKMQTETAEAEHLDMASVEAEGAEVPTLYEVYHGVPGVLIEERIIPHDNIKLLMAFHLHRRFVVTQDLTTLNCIRANLLYLHNPANNSKWLYYQWHDYRDQYDSSKTRNKMKESGIITNLN